MSLKGVLAADTWFVCAGRDMTDDSGREAALPETPGKPKALTAAKALPSASSFVVISVNLHFASDVYLGECFVHSGHERQQHKSEFSGLSLCLNTP